ncbi:MAG: hypothetical protein ACLFN5_02365 [bacterium]
MTECPVCRSPILGKPDRCGCCQTPLRRSRPAPPWSVLAALLFPGLGHLWLGHLPAGIFVMVFSFLLLGWGVIPLLSAGVGTISFIVATVLWLAWLAFWAYKTAHCRFHRLSLLEFELLIVSFLLIVNIIGIIYWIFLIVINL